MKKFGEPLTAQREQHYPRLLGQLAWSAMCLTWIRTWILWWQISLKEKGRESFSIQNHDLSDVGWNIFAHESMNDLPTIFASWPNFASACLYNLTWHLQHCFFSVEDMAKFPMIWTPTFQLTLFTSQDIFFQIIDNHFTHPPIFWCWWSTSLHYHDTTPIFRFAVSRCCWR